MFSISQYVDLRGSRTRRPGSSTAPIIRFAVPLTLAISPPVPILYSPLRWTTHTTSLALVCSLPHTLPPYFFAFLLPPSLSLPPLLPQQTGLACEVKWACDDEDTAGSAPITSFFQTVGDKRPKRSAFFTQRKMKHVLPSDLS